MNWTLDQLDIFVNCVNQGSFSAAARRLRRSQSRVSTAISELEIDLGVALFSRDGYTPILTSAGEQLYEEALRILEQCNTFQNNASLYATGQEISLVIALDEAIPVDKFESVFAQFAQVFPNSRLSIKTGSQGEISHWIDRREADIGISFGLNMLPERIERHTVAKCEQRLIVHKDHPLVLEWDNEISTLSKHRQLVILDNYGYSGSTVLSNNYWYVDNYYGINSLVAKGVGWAIVPEHIAAISEQITVFPVDGFPVAKRIDITVLKHLDTPEGPMMKWLSSRFAKVM